LGPSEWAVLLFDARDIFPLQRSLKKEKGSNVTFGDNVSTKIVGKGTTNLGNEKDKARNVLLVEDLKHNLLSVN
jgi:hypothetical protein